MSMCFQKPNNYLLSRLQSENAEELLPGGHLSFAVEAATRNKRKQNSQ
jgi:hypothetical protein